ncbi:MAG TPA: hypothetical protein VGH43_03670 [Jatrophihabitans sp.]
MAETNRCNEKFWDVWCDKPHDHRSLHSAARSGGRIMWGAQAHGNEPPPRSGRGGRSSSLDEPGPEASRT